jgi:hypothetical protein
MSRNKKRKLRTVGLKLRIRPIKAIQPGLIQPNPRTGFLPCPSPAFPRSNPPPPPESNPPPPPSRDSHPCLLCARRSRALRRRRCRSRALRRRRRWSLQCLDVARHLLPLPAKLTATRHPLHCSHCLTPLPTPPLAPDIVDIASLPLEGVPSSAGVRVPPRCRLHP